MKARRADVAVLWLGEMLLIPHLWPIVDRLARDHPDLAIDLWVSTSAHEALIRSWLTADHGAIRLRRAPGFRRLENGPAGVNPPLPAKLPMLLRLAPRLARVPVVLCAEQTSLWIPRILPARARFIMTTHGSGPLVYNRDGRLKCAYRLMVPSALHMAEHLANGIAAERIAVTGYMKASFAPSRARADLFPVDRPTILYVPHWQRRFSSWWDWGRRIATMLADQDRYNVILAPHQRLFERDDTAQALLESLGGLPHVHVDCGSFAMVDGSYTAAADIYLGDSSSQIAEYLIRPRPCVILQSPGISWRSAEEGGYQPYGDCVTDVEALWAAIEAAPARHAGYRDLQARFAATALGDRSADAPRRAAREIVAALAR
ncbi:MAG: hypothetical protein ABS87_10820 [Sphingomonas sp. SCN 67-18]|uniref:hypothetical protein n=1 Tax=uncultured Sphingomonas sp. TaxID=158754 RepID=UPI00086EF800|nr:hypothetical protein [Sphingomonas sp. SCN 67-18]ODU20522.1 MAG: hypothetical protein ABS87_10820 [Sphingomonas sp. SCN 67-18]